MMSQFLERHDLYDANIVITFFGTVLAIVLAAMLRHGGNAGRSECFLVRHGSRLALVAIALALLLSLLYSYDTGWQPWPGDFVLRCALDLYLFVGVIAPYLSPYMRERQMRRAMRHWHGGPR